MPHQQADSLVGHALACPAVNTLQSGFREGSAGRAGGCHCRGHPGLPLRGLPPSELLLAIAAFLVLGVLALHRGSRVLAGACCCLGLFFAGALIALVHAPGPPPELDAEGREIVILGGCVVEPPAISGERERFLLELEPHARAQVTLYTKEGESLPAAALRAEYRARRARAQAAQLRQPRRFRLRPLPGAPGHLLDRLGRRRHRPHPARPLRLAVSKAAMDLRAAALDRIERLYPGNNYDTGMMQALLIGQNFQLQRVWTEQYRNTGTFHALVISGTHVAILAAFFLFLLRLCFVPESAGAAAHGRGRVALRAGRRAGGRPACAPPRV